MKIESYRKRPLEVQAFKFVAATARNFLWGQAAIAEIEGVRFRFDSRGYALFNPGAKKWQPVNDGDYIIIIAPTGCRYPVQADQFLRNYAAIGEPETPQAEHHRHHDDLDWSHPVIHARAQDAR